MSRVQIFTPDEASWPRSADVVVIGGGIVGTATAFWLSRAGLDTVVVERRDGLGTLTTSRSAECIRAQFTEPAMAALARPSLEFFEHFADRVDLPGYDIGLRQQGYLFVTADPAKTGELAEAVRTYHQLGISDVELLTGAEVLARFPLVAPSVQAATFRQRDGWLSAHELTYGFAKASRARFLLRTRVSGIRVEQGAVAGVETDRGLIATRVVVDAAGPYAAAVARLAGVSLPITTVRRQRVVIASQRIPRSAPMTIDLDNGSYWRPESGGALFGWVDPDEAPSAPADDLPADWDYPAVVLEKLAALTPLWGEIAPQLHHADLTVSAGQYSYTPDDQPLLGPVPDVAGFHVNCGYWAGVMLSPQAGRWVAEMITGARSPADNPLRVTRFQEGAVTSGTSFLRGHH